MKKTLKELKLTSKLPLLITKELIIMPFVAKSISIGRKESVNAIRSAIKRYNGFIVVACQEFISDDTVSKENINKTAVLCKINFKDNKEKEIFKDSYFDIEIAPLLTVELKNIYFDTDSNYFLTTFSEIKINNKNKLTDNKKIKLIEEIKSFFSDYPLDQKTNKLFEKFLNGSVEELNLIYSFLNYNIIFNNDIKLKIFNTHDVKEKFELMNSYLKDSLSIKKSINEMINTKISNKLEKQQKDFFLKEKLKIIKNELDTEDPENKYNVYKIKLENNPYPEYIKKKIKSDLSRLESIPKSSAEYNVLSSYIDVMMSLPWFEKDNAKIDLNYAKKILNENHFGLEKVKERIIEYLAVCKLSKSFKTPVICFLGPPGVGKTTLCKSIADALKRKFVKFTVGGVKDESEIRGHRKTYLGSMPGKIIKCLIKAKVKNPVFLIDEIDKISSNYTGDPASALLEVLDPNQNNEFLDNYIDEPYDLSEVMFITTANYFDNIPRPLYDRMEIINISSYTELEKIEIAKKYLINKISKNFGLKKNQLIFEDSAIIELIRYYTRESGVRELERLISSVLRKYIVKYLEDKNTNNLVTPKIIEKFLGKRKFEFTEKLNEEMPGIVTGLAYTEFGGDILDIEVKHFHGTGSLILTGKLGDVMKESANTALGYIKSNCSLFNIDKNWFKENDIHIHVPEGAIPKDGPSAGITITTAILSSILDKKISKNIGMTGEITLRGQVLPIGGLKEKSISAHRSKLKTIIIPKKNKNNLDDIPKTVKKDLKIILVNKYQDVFDILFKNK